METPSAAVEPPAEAPVVVAPPAAVGPLPTADELRARARKALAGKWGLAAGAFVVAEAIVLLASLLSGTIPVFGTVAQYYFMAVFAFGFAAFSIALVRGGATFGHVFSGFGIGWRTLWLMGLSQTYIFLWALLLIVPGIRATFSYALIYFIRVDEPAMKANDVIARSKALMEGHRWRYFELNLSFIGWWLLVVLTCGLAAIWVAPYVNAAQAAFYEDLLDREDA